MGSENNDKLTINLAVSDRWTDEQNGYNNMMFVVAR